MPDLNDFQFLSRFVRDNRDAQEALLIEPETVRRLASAIDNSLKVGVSFTDAMRAMKGLPKYVATHAEIYGEPEPS